ncbi:MAG: MATE family efflux transporter [Myxococcales bacterium]|nr:MATE family efflux transporter [Myxococcales bacterium]
MTDSFREEIRQNLNLALPLVSAHIAVMMMGLVDTAIVGHFSGPLLGAVGIGGALAFAINTPATGLAFALEALCSQAVGAGSTARAWAWRTLGVRLSVLASIPLSLLALVIAQGLVLVGVSDYLRENTVSYLLGRLPGSVLFTVYLCDKAFLSALGKTRPVLIAAIVANVFNFIVSIVLVFGDVILVKIGLPAVGLPSFGVLGAGVGTSVSSLVMVWMMRPAARALTKDVENVQVEAGTILRLGIPLGFQLMAEVGVFTAVAVIAGKINETAAGAHQVAIHLSSLTFVAAMGMAGATAVRVGVAVGAQRSGAARRAGWVGALLTTGFMSVTGACFLLFPEALARIFTDDIAIIPQTASLIQIGGAFQLFDGLQCLMSGALRGAGDVRFPFVANVLAHWGIGFPTALLLAFTVGLGANGLWLGLTAGLIVISLLLTVRFIWVTGRTIHSVG